MNKATILGLTSGFVLSGLTIGSIAARINEPESPGEITPREVLSKALIPLAAVTTIGVVASAQQPIGGTHGGGSFFGGVALAVAGVALLAGGKYVWDSMMDN